MEPEQVATGQLTTSSSAALQSATYNLALDTTLHTQVSMIKVLLED